MVHHFPIFSHIFPMKMVVLWIVGLSMFGAKVSISTAIWSRASPTPGRVMGQRNPAPVENGRESPTGWWWLEHGLIFPYNVNPGLINHGLLIRGWHHWECHHPNWRTHIYIYFRGVAQNHQPAYDFGWVSTCFNHPKLVVQDFAGPHHFGMRMMWVNQNDDDFSLFLHHFQVSNSIYLCLDLVKMISVNFPNGKSTT